MLFTKWAFKNSPNAEPLAPEITLSSPDSPDVDVPDVGEKMSSPRSSTTPPRLEPVAAGEASPCSTPGTADITSDNVLCPIPAGVAAAWSTAAGWAANPPKLVVCWGCVNGVSSLATAEEAA